MLSPYVRTQTDLPKIAMNRDGNLLLIRVPGKHYDVIKKKSKGHSTENNYNVFFLFVRLPLLLSFTTGRS